jgi:hypothetical protein
MAKRHVKEEVDFLPKNDETVSSEMLVNIY